MDRRPGDGLYLGLALLALGAAVVAGQAGDRMGVLVRVVLAGLALAVYLDRRASRD